MLGLPADRLRVVVPDMGGGFGTRAPVYPEYALLLVAARRLGRPVGWTADRGEAFLTDCQARDPLLRGELALDAQGRFTALRLTAAWRPRSEERRGGKAWVSTCTSGGVPYHLKKQSKN